MAPLSYRQLDRTRKSIRLLTVFPGDLDDPIRCELTLADLDKHPSYIALSYTWDQSGGSGEIQCCGATIQVGNNLKDFLHRFRVWDEGRGNRLWVDALCINQQDVFERNHQVAQMSGLFSTATFTIAWLGEATDNSDLAYHVLSATRHCLRYSNDATRQALVDLLNRPYWSRVWVVQEFLMPFYLNIWWGGYRVKAHDFRQVVWNMTQLSLHDNPRYPLLWNTPGRNLLHQRERYQRMRYSNDNDSQAFRKMMRLQPLLQSFSASRCSLLHDKVYAFLGLATDGMESPYPILPNYDKSLVELSVDVVRNQYGHKLEEAKDAWKLIDSLCTLLGLSRREFDISVLSITSGMERQMYALGSRPKFIGCFDRHDLITVCTPSTLGLTQTIVIMGQEAGCMKALKDYISYCPGNAACVPSDGASITALIKGSLRETVSAIENNGIGHRIDASSLTDEQSDLAIAHLKRLHGASMIKKVYQEDWVGFFANNLKSHSATGFVGITHRSAISHEFSGLKIASYRWFGRFGAALLMICARCREIKGSAKICYDHEWTVVGSAFIRNIEKVGYSSTTQM